MLRILKVKLFLPALLWMLLIFILSSIPNLELQGEFSVYDLFLRKLAHIFEYTVLFLLWNRALGNWKKAFVISFAYALTDEIHQYFVPTRDGKIMDIFVDSIGISFGLLILKIRSTKHEILNKF